MREISFRAWHQGNKEMFYPVHNAQLFNLTPFCDFEVEQFTGLKDKNGVKIFEGDILKVNNQYGEFTVPVTFYNGYFATDNHAAKQIKNPADWDKLHDKVSSHGFLLTEYNQLMDGYSNISTYGDKKLTYDIEVIDNIHENKQ